MWTLKPDGRPRPRKPAEPEHSSAVASGGVSTWVRDKLGFLPDPKQALVLDSPRPCGILNCARQWGKSTIAAAKAVHHAATRPDTLTLVVSPSGRQSAEFLRKAADFLRRLRIPPKGDGDNEISLALPNGSRIVGLPGVEAKIRGFSSVSLLLIDEASRVSDDLYKAVRPMLAVSAGALWMMSTPFGKRGFFWETWDAADPAWERIQATGPDCPRIKPASLEGDRKAMGEAWYRQEYLCEFVDTVSGIFDRDVVAQAMTRDLDPLWIP